MSGRGRSLATLALVIALAVAAYSVFGSRPADLDRGGAAAANAVTTAPATASTDETILASPEPGRRDAVPTTDPQPAASGGALTVLVRWASGGPAPGVAVSFRTFTGTLPPSVLAQRVSDAEGRIELAALQAGKLELRSDRGGRLEVEIVAAQRSECVFTQPAGVAVDGVVVDRHGRAVVSAGVWLQTAHTDWTGGRVVATAAPDGTFALTEVPPGLSLGAIAAGHAPSSLVDLDTLDTAAPPVFVRLEVGDRGGAVEGRVVDLAGAPIAGATIAVGKGPTHLDWSSGRWTEQWTARTASSDAEGRFLIEGIATGDRPVAARADGYGIWRGDVAVSAGRTTWLDVTLGASATITGVVRDERGAPLGDATISAFDRRPGTRYVQSGQIDFDETFDHVATHSDARGHYRLGGVTPGAVWVIAQAAYDRRREQTVPFVRTLLHAEPGAEVAWDPVVTAGRTIDGIVVHASGAPMGGVFVTASDEQGGPDQVLVNDAEGRFRFVCLEGASYTLQVQYWSPPQGTPPLRRKGVVPGGGEVELRAPFDPPIEGPKGSVRGRVDDAGRRIPHAKALFVNLCFERGGWRTGPADADAAFAFDDVAAGRYRLLAMVGETAIAQHDWFELGPGEVRDLGILTTEPPGSVVVELVRDERTAELEPKLFFTREGWSRGAQLAIGRRTQARLDNLTPGFYRVRVHAPGMRSLDGEVTVVAGQDARLELQLEAAALVEFAVWFPEDRKPGNVTIAITGADGTVLRTSSRDLGEVAPRPFEQSVFAPRGEWTIAVTTDTGLAGSARFRVDALDLPEREPVRIEMK